MGGILDVFKGGKGEDNAPAVAVTGEVSGSRPGSTPSKARNAANIDSPAASYARERAAAARAQIEARKAMEESRKNSGSAKPDNPEEKKDENKPVGLKAPIRRPPSASINHAQAVAAQKEEQRSAEDAASETENV